MGSKLLGQNQEAGVLYKFVFGRQNFLRSIAISEIMVIIPPVTIAAAAAAVLFQPGADLPGLADGEVEEGGAEGGAAGSVQERVDCRVAPSCDKCKQFLNFLKLNVSCMTVKNSYHVHDKCRKNFT